MISGFGVEHGEIAKAKVPVRVPIGSVRLPLPKKAKVLLGGGNKTKRPVVAFRDGEAVSRHVARATDKATRLPEHATMSGNPMQHYGTIFQKRAEDLLFGKAYGRGPALDAARWAVGLTGTGAVGGGAVYGAERAHGEKKQSAKKTAAAAVLGGAAGQGVYQAAGYEAKHRAARLHEKSGMGRAQTDKKLKPAKKAHGAFTEGMYRHYPKDMPGAKIHRVLGWTHRGKTGMATGAAVTLGAGALAAHAASRSKENR